MSYRRQGALLLVAGAVLALLAGLALPARPGTVAARPAVKPGGAPAAAGATRTYYIAADEVDWDYAPAGVNHVPAAPFGETENVFVERGPDRIGSVYRKSLYREYSDESFSTRRPADPRWAHLGMLGPIIRAEVGDTIVVHFKNNTRFPASIHPHGVFYDKANEGSPYGDGTGDDEKADDEVAPGDTYV